MRQKTSGPDGQSARSTTLLAVCENPLEVSSIIPVARELERRSGGHIQVEFTSQDALLHQEADEAIREAGREIYDLPCPIQLSEPFFELSAPQKLGVLLATAYGLRGVMQNFDGVLCGIDSIIARMLIADARREGKPTFQIFASLDLGDAPEKSLTRRVKDAIRKPLGYLNGADFLTYPNQIGGTHCDQIFVMGERNEKSLIQRGVPSEHIFTYGIPRFSSLFENIAPSRTQPGQRRILYVTGAYAWHDAMSGHRLQQRQLRQIVQVLQERPISDRPEFVVKLHPREDPAYYDWMRSLEAVTVVPSDKDLYECIINSTVVATIRSTTAYEAALLHRVTLLTHFPQPLKLPIGDINEDFVVIQSVDELFRVFDIMSHDEDIYKREIEKQRENAEAVISPQTPQSSTLIARTIQNYLSNHLSNK